MVRPKGFEPLTPWFAEWFKKWRIFTYQYLTSVRHTQKQPKTATGST